MSGVIQDGWSYVIAAYALTGLGIGGYAVRLLFALRERSPS